MFYKIDQGLSLHGIPLLFFPYNSTCRNFQRDSKRWTMSAILTRPSSLVWKLRIGVVQSSHWLKREKSLIVHVLILEWPSQWREASQTGRTWDLPRTQGSRWDASRRKQIIFSSSEIKQNDNQWNATTANTFLLVVHHLSLEVAHGHPALSVNIKDTETLRKLGNHPVKSILGNSMKSPHPLATCSASHTSWKLMMNICQRFIGDSNLYILSQGVHSISGFKSSRKRDSRARIFEN